MSHTKKRMIWVKEMFIKNPKLRDSVEGLYYFYLKEIGYDTTVDTKTFLQDMSKRKIPYIDVFGRLSRKVQEENPDLRGLFYGKRKNEKEPIVRKEIKELGKII